MVCMHCTKKKYLIDTSFKATGTDKIVLQFITMCFVNDICFSFFYLHYVSISCTAGECASQRLLCHRGRISVTRMRGKLKNHIYTYIYEYIIYILYLYISYIYATTTILFSGCIKQRSWSALANRIEFVKIVLTMHM